MLAWIRDNASVTHPTPYGSEIMLAWIRDNASVAHPTPYGSEIMLAWIRDNASGAGGSGGGRMPSSISPSLRRTAHPPGYGQPGRRPAFDPSSVSIVLGAWPPLASPPPSPLECGGGVARPYRQKPNLCFLLSGC